MAKRAIERYNRGMEIDAEQLRIVQAMTPAQKLRAAWRLFESARELRAAALRAEHPDWTAEQIQAAVRDAIVNAGN